MIYYQLATPEVTTFDTNPVTGSANQTEPLTMSYKVADFGTEESLPAETTIEPAYAPINAVIAYSTDFTRQLANMYKDYTSQDTLDNLLATIGSALGGTLTKTWDSTNGCWSFSFSQS